LAFEGVEKYAGMMDYLENQMPDDESEQRVKLKEIWERQRNVTLCWTCKFGSSLPTNL